MDADQQNFIVALAAECKSHEDWLTIVRFGMPTLLKNQPFLMELIVREAEALSAKPLAAPSRTRRASFSAS